MAIVIDPLGREIRVLRGLIDLRGRRVLEVGCGSGRLTRRLLTLGPASIDAVDPDRAQVRQGRDALARRDRARVRFRVGHAERLPYRAAKFDCVVFAWAL
jgi:avermectin B 5-O-methyltransferase